MLYSIEFDKRNKMKVKKAIAMNEWKKPRCSKIHDTGHAIWPSRDLGWSISGNAAPMRSTKAKRSWFAGSRKWREAIATRKPKARWVLSIIVCDKK